MEDKPTRGPDANVGASSTGLETNIAGSLCYLLGFVTGVAFLVLEKQDREVRFHAYQSLATFGGLFLLSAATGVVPLIGGLVTVLLAPASLILWIVLMLKAYQGGEHFKLPVVGDWAEEQAAA